LLYIDHISRLTNKNLPPNMQKNKRWVKEEEKGRGRGKQKEGGAGKE
jgi:hypothetical protein